MARFKVMVLGTDEEITDNPPAMVLSRRDSRGLEARHDIKTSNLLSAVDLAKVAAEQTTLVLYVSRSDGWRPAWVALVEAG